MLVVALAGCTGGTGPGPAAGTDRTSRSAVGSGSPTAESSGPATPSATATPTAGQSFDASAALVVVRRLAAGGPREATSQAFGRAAGLVGRRFAQLGYDVSQQSFRVPAGLSWGIPVGAGRTVNVVARPPSFDRASPHLVVGAHLDTVPQSPGAEDNASGVATVLELARLSSSLPTRLPVVFVAFGAEEPRGPGDDEHHFGSLTYVERMSPGARNSLRGMVSLDRVGAPGRVPVCTGGLSPIRLRDQLLAAAERVDVPARRCENRTSDHWPFENAGETAVRVGGNPSPGYHSQRDRPGQVDRRQVRRVGDLVWEWLREQ